MRIASHVLFGKRDRADTLEGAKTESRAKFGEETVAGAQKAEVGSTLWCVQADSRRAQAPLRLCSGSAQAAPVCSPSAQVKAAVAHVRRLKRNQRKGKLIPSLWVFRLI